MAKRERQPHMNFYYDMYEAGRKLPERERKDLYTAILDYFWTGSAPRLTSGAAAVFTALRDRLDMSRDRSDRAKTAEGGRAVDAQWTSSGRAMLDQVDDKWTRSASIEGEGEREKEEERETTASLHPHHSTPYSYQLGSSYPDGTSARASSSRSLGEIIQEGGVI